jgi:hypothetical protein
VNWVLDWIVAVLTHRIPAVAASNGGFAHVVASNVLNGTIRAE